jgi:hypothetical protein
LRLLQVNANFQLANQNLSLALSEYGTVIKAQGRLHEAITIYEQVGTHHPRALAANE